MCQRDERRVDLAAGPHFLEQHLGVGLHLDVLGQGLAGLLDVAVVLRGLVVLDAPTLHRVVVDLAAQDVAVRREVESRFDDSAWAAFEVARVDAGLDQHGDDRGLGRRQSHLRIRVDVPSFRVEVRLAAKEPLGDGVQTGAEAEVTLLVDR